MADHRDRMFDDDAPITPADVKAARAFQRWVRGLTRLAVVVGVVVGALAVGVVDDWQRQQAMRQRCGARVQETIASLQRAPPTDGVLHRGDGVVVVDTPELAALLVDGRVVGSTLRCVVHDEFPARAWVR